MSLDESPGVTTRVREPEKTDHVNLRRLMERWNDSVLEVHSFASLLHSLKWRVRLPEATEKAEPGRECREAAEIGRCGVVAPD
jgi:hypothetical protein